MEEKVIATNPTPVTEKVVKTEPEVVAKPEVKEPEGIDPLTGPHLTNPFFYEVANYFGIEQREYDKTKEKLAVIVDWAFKEAKSKDPGDILLAIRHLEDNIQPADWGERRYANVYKYVRLASQKQSVEKMMSAFEKEGHGKSR